jgi:hypothetical protein
LAESQGQQRWEKAVEAQCAGKTRAELGPWEKDQFVPGWADAERETRALEHASKQRRRMRFDPHKPIGLK